MKYKILFFAMVGINDRRGITIIADSIEQGLKIAKTAFEIQGVEFDAIKIVQIELMGKN